MTEPTPGIRELVARAASDPTFAERLINNPESVGAEYNLTSAQIDRIRELASQGAFRLSAEAQAVQQAAYYG
jgi:hypothetical protein